MSEFTIDHALKQGVEAQKAGQVDLANRFYTMILTAQPKHPDANHNMGVLAVGAGKFEEALPFFKTALEANPATTEYWLSYIDTLIKFEKLTDAKAMLDQAWNKGINGDGFVKLKQRILGYTVPKRSETNRKSNLDTAIQFREAGKFEQAIELLKDQTNRFPEDADTLALLSQCLLSKGQVEAAKLHLNKAKKIAPEIASVRWCTIRLKLKEKKILQALNLARDTNQRFPDDIEGLCLFGACLWANNKISESLKVLNKAIGLNPNYAEALINRGLIRLGQKNKSDALADFNQAHRLKPHIEPIWDVVVELNIEAGRYSDAISFLIKMVEIDPKNEERLGTLALCYQYLRDFESAIATYNKALAIKPDFIDGHINLGSALTEQGRLKEAIEACNRALAIKPDHHKAYKNMGYALQEQGKLKDAVVSYRKAIAIKPDYYQAYNNMGGTLLKQGKLEEAAKAFNKTLDIKPDYGPAIENSLSLKIQLQRKFLTTQTSVNSMSRDFNLQILDLPKYNIVSAISSFLSNERRETRRHLDNFNACDPKIFANLRPKEKKFCSAYEHYISALLKEPAEQKPKLNTGNVIYHIGESHCLSYAHRHLEVSGEIFRIVPMITFGAKAFHFSKPNYDGFTAITRTNLVSIPKGSKVFISFGEIDCRPNEGFILSASKLDEPIEDLIGGTVNKYLKWFAEQNKNLKHDMHFLNVPAPKYNKKYNYKVNISVANAVSLFNVKLKKQIAQHGFDMIDIFYLTVGQGGFSNDQFHVDGYHLGAKIIPEIERQLNN